MTAVIDHLASLTGLRDRDTLDVSLAHAMRDILEPERVAVYRLIGDLGEERWLTRAALLADSPAATADPAWVELASLPRAIERPDWLECLTAAKIIETEFDEVVTTLFPVMSDTGAVGIIELQTTRGISIEKRRLVFGVLRIYRNVQTLLDYSERDTLTGLLNRKSFDDSFYKVSSLPLLDARLGDGDGPQTSGARYWLAVIDVDYFKRVNDRFGHLVGDEVLLLLSRIMRGAFQFTDQLYRFGGEEFVVLMLCNDEEDVVAGLDRFRRVVGDYAFPQVGKLTVSIGFTAIEVDDTPDTAFERADAAVYHAKHNGRDQVCNFRTMPAPTATEATELVERRKVNVDRRTASAKLAEPIPLPDPDVHLDGQEASYSRTAVEGIVRAAVADALRHGA